MAIYGRSSGSVLSVFSFFSVKAAFTKPIEEKITYINTLLTFIILRGEMLFFFNTFLSLFRFLSNLLSFYGVFSSQFSLKNFFYIFQIGFIASFNKVKKRIFRYFSFRWHSKWGNWTIASSFSARCSALNYYNDEWFPVSFYVYILYPDLLPLFVPAPKRTISFSQYGNSLSADTLKLGSKLFLITASSW